MTEHDYEALRDDPASVTGMFVAYFTTGAVRMVSKYATQGTLGELVDAFAAGRVRLGLNGDGTLDVESSDAPPSGN